MKKVTLLAAIVATVSFASCTAQSPKPELKTDIDSLSYSIGMAQTQGLKDYLTSKMEMDTAYFDDFIRGLKEVATSTDKKQNAYETSLNLHKSK